MAKNVPLNGRIEPELLERVRQEAKVNRRRLGQEIARMIEEALAVRDQKRQKERPEKSAALTRYRGGASR
jgi:hypothetical protein